MPYNDNIFSKIIRGDIPCDKVYEDDKILCFRDINPVARIHLLIIPKNSYIDFTDFTSNSESTEIGNFFKKIDEIAKSINISSYQLRTNNGRDSGQEIMHFHFHLISN
jgi:histidine triad (HIT) family protein